jgi:hypothetical protein
MATFILPTHETKKERPGEGRSFDIDQFLRRGGALSRPKE